MAKEKVKEKKDLKKGSSQFNLVGKAVVSDYTFKIDEESKNSAWTYSSANVGVDCGADGTIYAELMAGYSTAKNAQNLIYVHGKKLNEAGKEVDDFQNQFTIDWDDRLDESMHEEIGERSFITVGVEKKDDGKTYYKKFLSGYDAVAYMQEHLEKDMVVRVQGNINYSVYQENTQAKKEITSIVLSALPEDKFGASFTQTILVDSGSVGKLDKDKNTYPIDAYVMEYLGNVKVDKAKVSVKKTIVYPKRFELEHKNDEVTPKFLKKVFGARKDEAWEVTVEGRISKGVGMITTTLEDLPDDIQDLVLFGALTEEEALEKCVGKGSSVESYIITTPRIKKVEKDGKMTATIDFDPAKYTVDDYLFYSQALEGAGVKVEVKEEKEIIAEDASEEDLDDILNNM